MLNFNKFSSNSLIFYLKVSLIKTNQDLKFGGYGAVHQLSNAEEGGDLSFVTKWDRKP